MINRLYFLLLCLFLAQSSIAQTVSLEKGMVITQSVVVEPGTYSIPADSTGAIVIRGNNITVDFAGAVLDGASSGQLPDAFSGTGIRIEGGSNVVIKNAVVKGYLLGLWATDTPGIRITDSDFSYNYRQHLKSTIEREHNDDWMSYHQNEQDEWQRYGAAIYLRRAEGAQIDHVRITGGQNGILLTEVNDGLLFNNEITYNSGLGLGMYKSSRNRVQHNKFDWSVRGYSHGVYNRGQDSAGILIYEQSNENVFAYNSATHSGDGFFLWAGQTTMDTGEGGCNDNLLYANDFSYAPTNGIEVTFSRNHIEKNILKGCWHGIWGGYSFDTPILDNLFEDNDEHIAIEHGQNLQIEGNQFIGGNLGVFAWERAFQPEEWGYSQNRDVESRDYLLRGNSFKGVEKPLQIRNTDRVRIYENNFVGVSQIEVTDSEDVQVTGNGFPDYSDGSQLPIGGSVGQWNDNRFETEIERHFSTPPVVAPLPIDGAEAVGLSPSQPQTREYILVDEWGPVDFRSPVLWPRSPRKQIEQRFELVGPEGKWSLLSTSGVDSLSASSGAVPGEVTVWRSRSGVVDMDIELSFIGSEVTDRFGTVTPVGDSFQFGYSYFFVPIIWDVKLFNYTESTDPRDQFEAFKELIQGAPVFSETTSDLGYQWGGSPAEGLGRDHFASVSVGRLNVPKGSYRLDLTSDDGVRVWVDNVLVHDDWTYHPPKLAEIPLLLNGEHEIRIEHFEINGYATIVATLERTSQ